VFVVTKGGDSTWGGRREQPVVGEIDSAAMVTRVMEQQHRRPPSLHIAGRGVLSLCSAEKHVLDSNRFGGNSALLPIVQFCGVQVEQQGAGGALSGNRGGSVQVAVAAAAAVAFLHAAAAAAALVAAALPALRFAGRRQGVVSFYGSSWDWHSIHH
jgi:hypothetical protein